MTEDSPTPAIVRSTCTSTPRTSRTTVTSGAVTSPTPTPPASGSTSRCTDPRPWPWPRSMTLMIAGRCHQEVTHPHPWPLPLLSTSLRCQTPGTRHHHHPLTPHHPHPHLPRGQATLPPWLAMTPRTSPSPPPQATPPATPRRPCTPSLTTLSPYCLRPSTRIDSVKCQIKILCNITDVCLFIMPMIIYT